MALVVLEQINNLSIMRLLIPLLFIISFSCNPKKNKFQIPEDYNYEFNNVTQKKIDDFNYSNKVDFDNLLLFGKASIDYNNINYSLDLSLRFKKSSKILLTGNLIIPVFKTLISQDKIIGYQKFDKTFFEASYSDVFNKLGIGINYFQIENLFLGLPIIDLQNKKDFKIYKNDLNLLYTFEKDKLTFNMVFNKDLNQLISQEIIQNQLNRSLKVYYDSFKKIENYQLPLKVLFIINDGKNLIKLNITNDTFKLNNDVSFSFEIPDNYRKVKF